MTEDPQVEINNVLQKVEGSTERALTALQGIAYQRMVAVLEGIEHGKTVGNGHHRAQRLAAEIALDALKHPDLLGANPTQELSELQERLKQGQFGWYSYDLLPGVTDAYSLALGWALARGMNEHDARDFARSAMHKITLG